jgi:purine-nucleoside phosphorylase
MSTGYEAIQRAAAFLRTRLGNRHPSVALVLGSGLGDFANTLESASEIPYHEVPGFPSSQVAGHVGKLVFGRAPARRGESLEVAAMMGRVHCYEGHPPARVVFPLRTLISLGFRTVILTNAAGGCDAAMSGGELVLIKDHLNLSGTNPLLGENDDRLGPRFPDLTTTYDPALRAQAQRAAQASGIGPLREGVYAWLLGPSYETPAEIRMVRTLGGDLVGMSTVPEAIAARHMGARVLAISCVTNLAAGVTGQPLSHDEVMQTAARVRPRFIDLLTRLLAAMEIAP